MIPYLQCTVEEPVNPLDISQLSQTPRNGIGITDFPELHPYLCSTGELSNGGAEITFSLGVFVSLPEGCTKSCVRMATAWILCNRLGEKLYRFFHPPIPQQQSPFQIQAQ
jgi:hypothetical protein